MVYPSIEYYSAIKLNTSYMSWVNLKNMLSEKSQIPEITLCMIPLIILFRKGKFTDIERLVVAQLETDY